MRIGINTNPSAGGGQPATVDQMIEQVASIAEAGFATAAFSHNTWLDALTLIAVAGREVPGIELATAVVPIYTRHPTVMAQQALSTQASVGGRLVLGIGASHKPAVEDRLGLSFVRPLEYMQEYLQILLPLLRGEAVDFSGKRLTARAQFTIAAQAPSVVLAALGERMLRLAGQQTDGTSLWMVGPRTLAEHITPRITEAAREAGRGAPRIMLGLPTCVTNDVAAARARAARSLGFYDRLPSYKAMLDREGATGPADVLVTGTEEEVDRQLDRFADAGATDFIATPLGSSEERRRTFEFLRERTRVSHGRSAAV